MMGNTTVKMVIVNRTQLLLVLRDERGISTVATIADGGEHTLEIDINWTYQEFSLKPAAARGSSVLVSFLPSVSEYQRTGDSMIMENTMPIVKHTQKDLVLRIGNQDCFADLATIADGGKHNLEIDFSRTYLEFSWGLANAGLGLNKVIVTSDDCCDNERKARTTRFQGVRNGDVSAGLFETYHWSLKATRFTPVAHSDPAHRCKSIPCDYCGLDWPHPTIELMRIEEKCQVGQSEDILIIRLLSRLV